jgi:hypothetical protein
MTNFNRYDEQDARELFDFSCNSNPSALELVESWAEDWHCISSEEELSELFDSEIAPMVIAQYGENDEPAINEAFNDWTDGLCSDGVIHEEQYSSYCYVGKYSN